MLTKSRKRDPLKAMDDAKGSGNIADKSCKNTVAEQYDFGQKVGVTGTPAIILPNGSMVPGYQPPQQLLKVLQSGS